MSSKCPAVDCGFQSEDSELFNDHMRAHDSALQDARDASARELVEIHDKGTRELAELEAQKFSARQLEAAFNVIAPLVRAVRLLMSDEKMRRFIIETAKDLFRELEETGTGAVSIPVNDPPKE